MININLLPAEQAAGPRSLSSSQVWVVPAGIALALTLAVTTLSLRQVQQIHALRQEMEELRGEKVRFKQQLGIITEVTARRDELSRRLEAAKSIDTDRGGRVELVSALVQAVPRGLWLVSFSESPGNHARLEGKALNEAAVFRLMSALEEASAFRDVSLSYLKRDPGDERGVVDFLIECFVGPPA